MVMETDLIIRAGNIKIKTPIIVENGVLVDFVDPLPLFEVDHPLFQFFKKDWEDWLHEESNVTVDDGEMEGFIVDTIQKLLDDAQEFNHLYINLNR